MNTKKKRSNKEKTLMNKIKSQERTQKMQKIALTIAIGAFDQLAEDGIGNKKNLNALKERVDKLRDYTK